MFNKRRLYKRSRLWKIIGDGRYLLPKSYGESTTWWKLRKDADGWSGSKLHRIFRDKVHLLNFAFLPLKRIKPTAIGTQARLIHFTLDIQFKSRKLSSNFSTTSSSENISYKNQCLLLWMVGNTNKREKGILIIKKTPHSHYFQLTELIIKTKYSMAFLKIIEIC